MDGRVDQVELSLFDEAGASRSTPPPAADERPASDPLEVIEDDLDAWERLCRMVEVDARESCRLRSLGRDLKALRDCFRATAHPRVRQALLREAESISRRMRMQARRLRIPGEAIRIVPLGSEERERA